VMNAAAEIEDAANCLQDSEAKRVAHNAAKHYRDAANALCVGAVPNVKYPSHDGIKDYRTCRIIHWRVISC